MKVSRYRLALGVLLWVSAGIAHAEVDIHSLRNNTLLMELTPDIGGRVLSFQLIGQENFLRVNQQAVQQKPPELSAETNNVSYFGHEMWVGPQSAWWTRQTLNPQRLATKAVWPPDPYLFLAPNQVLEKSPQQLVLQSPPSPVTGVQLSKTYRLLKEQHSVELAVEAKNIRAENIAWDLWFNTRVHPDTQVYVPVAKVEDVRVDNFINHRSGPVSYSLTDGMLALDLLAPPAGKMSRHGKIFIQPSAGWMAGFRAGQVFIISFPLLPLAEIHPEQGQIELYHDYRPESPADGILEMELHAAYRTLAPGETMSASERWTLLPYSGADTHAARQDFLRKQLRELGIIE